MERKNNMEYEIKEVYKEKKWWDFKKPKLNYYKLMKNNICLSSSFDKKYFKSIIEKHEKWLKEPKYKVFKLGSGEFEILQKSNFQTNEDYYIHSTWTDKQIKSFRRECRRI